MGSFIPGKPCVWRGFKSRIKPVRGRPRDCGKWRFVQNIKPVGAQLAKGKWSGTSDLRIRAVGALSECFFRLKDIYQPQGGESRPRFSARAHAVGSRVDCLGPRFGPRAVEPPERNNRFHFGSEGLGGALHIRHEQDHALAPKFRRPNPTSRPLKTGRGRDLGHVFHHFYLVFHES